VNGNVGRAGAREQQGGGWEVLGSIRRWDLAPCFWLVASSFFLEVIGLLRIGLFL
jgi:hypothetical protein